MNLTQNLVCKIYYQPIYLKGLFRWTITCHISILFFCYVQTYIRNTDLWTAWNVQACIINKLREKYSFNSLEKPTEGHATELVSSSNETFAQA